MVETSDWVEVSAAMASLDTSAIAAPRLVRNRKKERMGMEMMEDGMMARVIHDRAWSNAARRIILMVKSSEKYQ